MIWRRVLVAAAVLLPAAGLLASSVLLDEAALKARAAEAVQRATGRALAIAGPVQITWSLIPTLAASGVVLANPPGMSRPAMLQAERVEVRVALLPLLAGRVEVRRLTLTRPDLLLERDAAGRGNWEQVREPPPPAAAAPPAVPQPRRPMEVVLGTLEVLDGRVAWRASAGPPEFTVSGLYAAGTVVRREEPASVPVVPVQATTEDRVFSGAVLPFAALRRMDASLHIEEARISWRTMPAWSLHGRLALHNGRLLLEPVAQGAGGTVRGQFAADAMATPETVALSLTVRRAATATEIAPGGDGVDFDMQLRAVGGTAQALAASLDGHVGLVLVNAGVDDALTEAVAGALRQAGIPQAIGKLRCLVVRATAERGVVVLHPLMLEAERLTAEGRGQANLADETFSLTLDSVLRMAGGRLSIPVQWGGTLREPVRLVSSVRLFSSGPDPAPCAVPGER